MKRTWTSRRPYGGPDGMRHFMSQFGPALKWPWTKLMDVPEMTEALIDKIAQQSDDQAAGAGLRELERKRDDCIIAVMQSLKAQDFGAGRTLGEFEKALYARAHAEKSTSAKLAGEPIKLFEMNVPTDWTDYNNHMNESRYLQGFSNTSMDDIIKKSGVKKGNLSFYFKSKDELGYAVLNRFTENFMQTNQRFAAKPGRPLQKIL